MTIKEIEDKIRELRELQALIDEAEAEAESIKDQIKANMTAQGVDEFRAGEYKVTWKAVTSSRVDTTALKASLPDVAARFTCTSTSRRFCVA